MSKSKAKGTAYENHVRDTYLTDIWPDAERAALSGINDYGDFTNVGKWLVEAKVRARLAGEIIKWALTAISKVRWRMHMSIRNLGGSAPSAADLDLATRKEPWCVVFAGDKRRRDQPSVDLVLTSADHYFDLVRRAVDPATGNL